MARYINDLKGSLHENLGLYTIRNVAETSSLTLKTELMDKSPQNFSSFRRYSPHNNFKLACDKEKVQ